MLVFLYLFDCSGAYAARLKTELDTLKDTNAKLSATLEEKTSTVKELNVQLANYKSRISQMEEMVFFKNATHTID